MMAGFGSYAFSKTAIEIAMDNGYPPYAYANKTGPAGFYVKKTQEIFEKAGIDFYISSYPWVRALKGAMNGDYVGSGFYRTDDRAKHLNYSNPFYTEVIRVYGNVKEPDSFSNIESLKGKRVAVRRGFSYGEEFDEARDKGLFNAVVVEDEYQSFKMLHAARVDFVVSERYAAAKILKALKIEKYIKGFKNPLAKNNIYIVVPKGKKYGGLIERINKVVTPEFLEKCKYSAQ